MRQDIRRLIVPLPGGSGTKDDSDPDCAATKDVVSAAEEAKIKRIRAVGSGIGE